MPTLLKRTLSTLAILLVACAQVFGLQRGYECHHQVVAVLTAAEHCHHLDSGFVPCATTHAGESTAHSDHDDDGDDEENSERHAPLKVSTTAATASLASATAPAFTALLIAELPSFDPILMHSGTAAHPLKLTPHLSGERPPPVSLQVARCIVLLV
jgi:hypothetical protein